MSQNLLQWPPGGGVRLYNNGHQGTEQQDQTFWHWPQGSRVKITTIRRHAKQCSRVMNLQQWLLGFLTMATTRQQSHTL
jgi:hypothetical protein